METLLVVEDNRAMRNGIRDTLEQEGFTVLTAAHGGEALQQMASARPDLILSDIAMPVMDGFTFFKVVRTRPDWLTIPFLFLTARSEKEDVMTGRDLGADDYLIKPLTRDELVAAVRSRLTRARQLLMAQIQHSHETSLLVLANAIEARDQYTRGHVERVAAYAQAIACHLDWRDIALEHLRFGGILHDIGKIGIRESTLHKTTPLTDEEWVEIKSHPVIGAEMLKSIPYLAHAIPIIRHHHERWDGRGYPDGLAGEAIPPAARIVAVADSFDAMTSNRCYRRGRTWEQALAQIQEGATTQYDPAVVVAFQTAWERGEIQAIIAIWESVA